MSATDVLLNLVRANRQGEGTGLYSICSAERLVLEAGMAQALRDGGIVCIESTCNQVNQLGGYTGMTPQAFRGFVSSVAERMGFPEDRILLGGDHLGPWVWQREPAESAMAKARELVRAYVHAGYRKIHLDASMRLADDPGGAGTWLDEVTVTERAVELCRIAEEAHAELPAGSPAPVYVIGTEVPTPGGERAEGAAPSVTRVADVARTLTLARDAFERASLLGAWERVIAVVTQPGVEFGDEVVFDYEPAKARMLSSYLEHNWDLVYEAHSTDYQTAASLGQMVEDHFAILKVGPWLTFAMREALFGLESIERELYAGREDDLSRLRQTLETVMLKHPEYWESYYRGSDDELRLARAYSYSDRCRYYWPRPGLRDAVARLFRNLCDRPIPLTLLSQFMPDQYEAVRLGQLAPVPQELVRHKLLAVTGAYATACGLNDVMMSATVRVTESAAGRR
jgi:D-tagatose-1,6-bisphosphate aldolase subunit GatZ/KbaZ